jgi:FdhD protein
MQTLPDDASARSRVQTYANGAPERDRIDWIAVEAPLELWLGGKPATVLMRTPGHDEELVRGFLFSEGIIAGNEDIVSIDRPPNLDRARRGNVLNVHLKAPRNLQCVDRMFYSNASCGVCGKRTIESLEVRGPASESQLKVRRSVLAGLPQALKDAQPTFAKTGGVHASALVTAEGEIVAVREDVGRHNALDKLIGWALAAEKIPLTNYLLLVSGRVSYEIVQKAVSASLPLIAAVGAPSSLAIELAEQFDLTLVGFLRADALNVYANGDRVVK